jgi:hypothetical protein
VASLRGPGITSVWNFNWRKGGDPPPRIEHWMNERVRLAAATFADRVGRGRDGVYWRLRKDTYYSTIRAQKRERYRERPA